MPDVYREKEVRIDARTVLKAGDGFLDEHVALMVQMALIEMSSDEPFLGEIVVTVQEKRR